MPPRQPGSVPDSSERRWWLARLASWPGLLVAVLLAVWLTTGLWGREPPSGDDTMAHLVRAQFLLDELVPHAQLDGWQPRFGLGYQQFLFTGPGSPGRSCSCTGCRLLLSVAGAFKVAAVASFVALPLSVAYLAVCLGFGRRSRAGGDLGAVCVQPLRRDRLRAPSASGSSPTSSAPSSPVWPLGPCFAWSPTRAHDGS